MFGHRPFFAHAKALTVAVLWTVPGRARQKRPDLAGFPLWPIEQSGFGIGAFHVSPIAAGTAEHPFDFSLELERYRARIPKTIVAYSSHYGPTAESPRMRRKDFNKFAQDGWLRTRLSRRRRRSQSSWGQVSIGTIRGIDELDHYSIAVDTSRASQCLNAANKTSVLARTAELALI
jgi:hypothetical protein